MRILLTNDDGIYAEGLQVLVRRFQQVAETFVVAPDHEQSATGHAITMHRPLRAEKIKFLHSPKVLAWSVNGTPADCVKLAVEAILPEKPDLVISGINRGANLGTDVLYSGTVSAAIEAAILGLPAIAVSLTEYKEPVYDYAAEFICKMARSLTLEKGISPGTLLNVNVPGCGRESMSGVSLTRLGVRQYRNAFERRTDPRGRTYYWLAGELIETMDGDDTDVAAIKRCRISVTPIHFDLTNHDLLARLKDWKIEL
ncbi:MAG: 5'/3'-nucleotidase SurE [Dethiobacter sp.]|nr:5'/3'-nucleotidase SurE [Dethiobacter sp.]